MDTQNNSILTIGALALLALVLCGLFALIWHGDISGDAGLALVGGIVTAMLGIFGVHSGVKAGAKAALAQPEKKES